MKSIVCCLLLSIGAAAQTWEAGAFAGGGFYNHRKLSNALGTAEAGFANGVAAGVFLTQNLYRRLGGQIRYAYQRNELEATASGQRAVFSGDSHALHYDWLVYPGPPESRLRPFVLGGAGFKRYRGTGTETLRQPLSQFALLTQTTEWKPLVTFGGGVKWRLSDRLNLYLELRDYFSQFPKKVIAPAPRTSLGGWLHDFVPTVGLGATF